MYNIKGERLVSIGIQIQANFSNLTANLHPTVHVTAEQKRELINALKGILEDCIFLKLVSTVALIEAAVADYAQDLGQTQGHLKNTVTHITKSLYEGLSRQVFVSIDPDRSRYMVTREDLALKPLFGPEVADSFGSAADDIYDASICFATYRNTACVFHCMRVAERGLLALAKDPDLNVPLSSKFEYENWLNIIQPIEKAIRELEQKLPRGSEKATKLQFYSQAATQFFYWKNAWRNHVSHSRGTYTDEETDLIFKHVEHFMQHLAKGGLRDAL